MKETTAPIAISGFGKLYTKSDDNLYFQDGSGVEKKLSIIGKVTDATAISLLTDTANWSDTTGGYVGTAITGTSEGQYYSDTSYFYFCYSDNTFLRIDIRASISGKLTDATAIALLTNVANWTGVNYTGTAITGTYEGMYYNDGTYKYEAYSDNIWFRTALI